MFLSSPLPRGDDDIALNPGRTLRLVLRQLAGSHSIGPVAKIFERHAAELSREAVHHPFAGLAGGNATHPRLFARLEFAERRRDGAGRFLAKLMTPDAIDVVHALAPDVLCDLLRDIGAAAEILDRWDLQQGEPVD